MKVTPGKDDIVYEGTYTRMIERSFTTLDGSQGIWEVVERKTHGPSIFIIAITDQNEVIIEKNYRIPIKGYVYEIPAGLLEKDEAPKNGIARELLEETGYQAPHIDELFSCCASPGLLQESFTFFFATGCKKVAEPNLEPSEDIEVVLVPLSEYKEFIFKDHDDVKLDIKVPLVYSVLAEKGLL